MNHLSRKCNLFVEFRLAVFVPKARKQEKRQAKAIL